MPLLAKKWQTRVFTFSADEIIGNDLTLTLPIVLLKEWEPYAVVYHEKQWLVWCKKS